MVTFTDKEKNFIKRAIVSTQPDLDEKEEIDPTKREDLIKIMRLFRGRGYIVPRRSDQGKEFGLWHSIMKKLGVQLKTREEKLEEAEKNRVKGMMERLNEIYTSKINSLEQKLLHTKEQKEEVLLETERQIQQELDKIEKKKIEAMKRLEDAKTARERVLKYKNEKKASEKDIKDIGLMKCIECGEWFNGSKGLKIHMKKVHPESD